MTTVDGSNESGSGTIVRYTVALAALLGEPVRVINVRHSRTRRGLRPQHLASVLACAELCGASTDGLHVDSREFTFTPGGRIGVAIDGIAHTRKGPRNQDGRPAC